MTSEDFEQLEANIVAKYAGISQTATPKKAANIDKQIQDFASNFSSAYKKFKELFNANMLQYNKFSLVQIYLLRNEKQ